MEVCNRVNTKIVERRGGGCSNTHKALGWLLVLRVGSQTYGHSPPHSTFVLVYEVAVALAPDLAFSMPSPPPHAYNVVEDIHHHKYDEGKSSRLISPTPKSLEPTLDRMPIKN